MPTVSHRPWSQRLLDRVRRILFYGHWMVGVVDEPIANALTWTKAPPVRWLEPVNSRRYIADPFPWPGSANTILAEGYHVATGRGYLVTMMLGAQGLLREEKIDLPVAGHLSFPFLFKHGEDIFMMPESSAARRLEIFRWREQEKKWFSHAIIMEGKEIADAVLFEKDGIFWISYTDTVEDPHDNLHLIYAAELTGPWRAHPANPVQRGKEHSRNGGPVFTIKNKLYRPAQDCSRVYGGSLRIMEITACTATTYEEKEVTHILPSSHEFPDGFHSLVAWGDKCLVDGMRLRFSAYRLGVKILRRLGLFPKS